MGEEATRCYVEEREQAREWSERLAKHRQKTGKEHSSRFYWLLCHWRAVSNAVSTLDFISRATINPALMIFCGGRS